MGVPYADQVEALSRDLRHRLGEVIPAEAWLAPATGPESGFRNKAKLAIGGTKGELTFGILDSDRVGIDLRDCGLYEPALARGLVELTETVTSLGLTPYEVARRSGELKHLIVTASPLGELMARLVLRSPGQLPRLREGLEELRGRVPGLRVVSANLQPEHKAVLEGEEEILLTDEDHLPMPVGDLVLRLRPRSFFQTNTIVTAALYQQAGDWVAAADPTSVLDLYCGVGGFALTAARSPGNAERVVAGIESSPEAVAGARATAADLGVRAEFTVGDARGLERVAHDMVVVNPPRRGIGASLCAAIERARPGQVIYSSCNAETLARDLSALPGYRVRRARFFDMFPQTWHHEVMVLLERS